jgi:hypothetical protein
MPDGTHIELGHAMITLVEPTKDPERLAEYNRWYEHDHALSGVMVGPWAFSYGRFVATKPLKQLRYPSRSTVADPVETGSFIAFYWYLKDRADEHFAWSFPQTQWLGEQGRMNTDRDHVATSLYDFVGAVNRPAWPVPAEISLDHRYDGLVVSWIDRAEGTDLDALAAWLLDEGLPGVVAEGTSVAQALVFRARDFPGVPNTGYAVGEKLLVAFFLQADPRELWESSFAGFGDAVEKSGLGTVGFVAPFIPVIPGTPAYLDELW